MFEPDECMYAIGQGALGVECLATNLNVVKLLEQLNDPETYFKCLAERSFLRTLEGGCSIPIAACSLINSGANNEINLHFTGKLITNWTFVL